MSRFLRWLPFALFAAFIGLVVYLADTGEGPKHWAFLAAIPYGDKLGHVGLMGTLSLLLNLALGARLVRIGPVNILLGSLIIVILVTGEEISQHFLPSRTFDLVDLAADYVGIFLAGRLALWLCRKRRAAA